MQNYPSQEEILKNVDEKMIRYYAYKWLRLKKYQSMKNKIYYKTKKGQASTAMARARSLQRNQGKYLCSCGKSINFDQRKRHEQSAYHNKWKGSIEVEDELSLVRDLCTFTSKASINLQTNVDI